MRVIHLSVHHVQHRHAYLRRSIPVFGPFEGQSDSLTIQLARKLPLETRLGALPPTVMTANRDRAHDNGSGIRLFTVPAGLDWSDPADDIEVIHAGWRYAVVAPSIHPEGRVYVWRNSDGTPAEIPSPATLPALPAEWVEHLSRPSTARSSTRDADVEGFLAGLPDGAPTAGVSGLLTDFEAALDGPDRHGAMLRTVDALAAAGAGGAKGVPSALAMAEAAYTTVKGSDGVDDFARALAGSVARITDGRLAVYTHADALTILPKALSVAEVPPAPLLSSWAPRDLSQYLDTDDEGPKTTMMPRSDGVFLIYPGLTHSFHGESESGKSMLLQFETVRLIMAGRPVLFVDFESDPRSIVARLRAFGATRESLANLTYVRPEENLDIAAWENLLTGRFDLAVVDGVTDSLALLGYATKDNDDITKWNRVIPRMIADKTGAAVAVIDHVTKASGDRGRFAIGGQSKMSGLTGAAYIVEVEQALAPGRLGVISVRVGKDRPGAVREHGGPFRKSDRTQEIVRVVVDSRDKDHPPIVTWEVPNSSPDAPETPDTLADHRAGVLRERVSRVIEEAGADGISGKRIEEEVGGNRSAAVSAVGWLLSHGHISTRLGPRNAKLQQSVKPYRQADPDEGGEAESPF